MRPLFVFFLFAITLTASACQLSTDTVETAETGPKTYGSVAKLLDASIAAGYDCPKRNVESYGLAGDVGSCSDQDNFRIVSQRYSGTEMQREANSLATEFKKSGTGAVLVGPNWVINASKGPLKRLQKSLGGAIAVY